MLESSTKLRATGKIKGQPSKSVAPARGKPSAWSQALMKDFGKAAKQAVDNALSAGVVPAGKPASKLKPSVKVDGSARSRKA